MNPITLAVLLATYLTGANSVCTDKNALFSVKATVHLRSNYTGHHVNDNFNELQHYIGIDVYQANVVDLCEGMVKNFPVLQTLSFIGLNIVRIMPNTFQNVPRLREVSLSVNKLTGIPKGSFNNLPSLEVLYLSANDISYIEENAFGDMQRLKAVHLDRNKLGSISGNWFKGSPQVRLLDFKFNLVEKLERANFEGITPKHSDAITLFFDKNRIDDVDDLEIDLPNPVVLHLEGNQLIRFSNSFHKLQEGSKMYLNDNEINCVSDDVADILKNTTKELYLLNNPITCACLKRIDDVLDTDYGNSQFHYSSTCVNCPLTTDGC